MMSIEWAKLVATELLVIRMSRPFAAKPGVNWVMKKFWLLISLDSCLYCEDDL